MDPTSGVGLVVIGGRLDRRLRSGAGYTSQNGLPMWLNFAVGVGIAIVASWLALVVALIVVRPDGRHLGEALRILPDVLRLLRRLAADSSLPRGVRIQLGLLLVYLASPIDLIPDFIPVLGYADDAIISIAVLRSVARHAGLETVRQSWPGTDMGFATLCRVSGLDADGTTAA